MILVRRCTKVRQDWRLEFVCGARADRFASRDFHVVRTIADTLGCAPAEAIASVEKTVKDREENFKQLREAQSELAGFRAAALVDAAPEVTGGFRLVTEVVSGAYLEYLQVLVSEIAKRGKNIALLAAADTGQVILHQHPDSPMDLAAVLKELLARFPGKGGGTRNFVRAKLSEPHQAAALIAAAKELILS
jgi:alanyl-tRNA synthetase